MSAVSSGLPSVEARTKRFRPSMSITTPRWRLSGAHCAQL